MILGAACGGGTGSDPAASAKRAPASSPTTTTVAEHRIDVYTPIPAGSLHGTPRPPLENTGDDYVAITESLIANFRWLTENPDRHLLAELSVPGTAFYESQFTGFATLERRGWRVADDRYVVVRIEPTSATPEAVSLRLTDQLASYRNVDAYGAVVSEVNATDDRSTCVLVLVPDQQARWRIAECARQSMQVDL